NKQQRLLRVASKYTSSRAKHNKSNHQQNIANQISGHQRADHHAATHDHEILARALLEVRHVGRNVAVQQSRVRPVELCRRVARGDALVSAIERILKRAAPRVPGGQELLVGAPPEQPRAIPAHALAHLGDARLVAVWDPPAAALKPIPRVLVWAARSLHHAVKRHPIHPDYLSHLISYEYELWRSGRLV